MNVRFFGGRKEEYVNIPKHNPIGLYFCADTRELFLGDKLLSDGLRVVSTFADLPSISEHRAAEGVIYFVVETKNGYVLPHGHNEWLQVIYAPDTESSVKTISFAGIDMEEVEGVFTIDRINARTALGFIVPEGMEDQDVTIATEDFVRDEIAKIDIPEVSLDGYAKTSDIPTSVSQLNNDAGYITDISGKADINHRHDDLYETKGAAEAVKNELLNGAGDAYNTLKELSDLIGVNQGAIEALNNLATSKADKEHEHFGYLTEHQDISHLATKEELPDVSKFITAIPAEYVTETELNASIEGFATEQYVINAIANQVPVESLAKKEEVVEVKTTVTTILPKVEKVDEIVPIVETLKTTAATQEWVKEQNYLTEHQSLDDYAKKADLFNKLSPFTTTKLVTNAIGTFNVGDDIKSLTLIEIITKLLGLKDTLLGGVVEEIITQEIPMYSVTAAGTLAEVPYNLVKFTTETAAEEPIESCFYQIVDEANNVIESGYQEIQTISDNIYYIIVLPKGINYDTMITIQGYDAINSRWAEIEKFNMTSDPTEVKILCEESNIDISHIDTNTHIIWVSDTCPTGSKLRYIITEEPK